MKMVEIEKGHIDEYYLTAGNVDIKLRGRYHITDMERFKRAGLLWRLGIANSRLSTNESIDIITLNTFDEPVKISASGKAFYYNILGIHCMAFEELSTKYIKLYAEFTNELKIYARNMEERK